MAAFLLPGCSPTSYVVLDRETARGDTLSLPRLNSRLSERQVTVRHANGQETEGTYLRSSRDSCFLLATDSSTHPTVVLTADIQRIEYRDHLSGFVGGLLSGVFLGILLAGGAFSISWSGGSTVLAYLVLLASFTSFIGLPIYGAVDGVPNTIMFPRDSSASVALQHSSHDTVRTEKPTLMRTPSDTLTGDRSGGGGGQLLQ